MANPRTDLSRRDFMKGVGGALAGMALGLPTSASGKVTQAGKSRVVLIRNKDVVSGYLDPTQGILTSPQFPKAFYQVDPDPARPLLAAKEALDRTLRFVLH